MIQCQKDHPGGRQDDGRCEQDDGHHLWELPPGRGWKSQSGRSGLGSGCPSAGLPACPLDERGRAQRVACSATAGEAATR